MAIEDLACSLFLWEEGNYRFDSLDAIQEYIVGGVTFPVDAITMEAMRRSDEWKRIRQHISGGTVFAIVNKPAGAPPAASPLSHPLEYITNFVDGQTTVAALCEKSIILPYRVYEALFGLWQKGVISPLAVKRQQNKITPVPAGISASNIAAAVVSISSVLAAVCALFAFSIVGRATFFHAAILKRAEALGTIMMERNERKIMVANLEFRTLRGYAPPDLKSLVKEHLICQNDLFFLRDNTFIPAEWRNSGVRQEGQSRP